MAAEYCGRSLVLFEILSYLPKTEILRFQAMSWKVYTEIIPYLTPSVEVQKEESELFMPIKVKECKSTDIIFYLPWQEVAQCLNFEYENSRCHFDKPPL